MPAIYLSAIPRLALIFLGLYFFELASFPFSIDEEYATFRKDASVWITQGRWGAYLVETFVLPQPAIPVVAPAIFGAGCILSFLLILDSFRERRRLVVADYVTFAIYCGYPTWFLIVEFYSNIGSIGLALMACALCVWLTLGRRVEISFPTALLPAALLAAFAISVYQSFLLLLVGMACGIVLLRQLRRKENEIFRDLFKFSLVVIAGVLIYLLLNSILKTAYSVEHSYTDKLININELLSDPRLVLSHTIKAIGVAYGADVIRLGGEIWAALIVGLLGLLSFMGLIQDRSAKEKILLCLLILVILLIPFLFHPFTGGWRLPYRSLVAIPFAVWLLSYLAVSSNRRAIAAVSLLATSLLIFQSIVLMNRHQAANYAVSRHDMLMAGAIFERMSTLPGYDRGKAYSLAVFGGSAYRAAHARPVTSPIGYSFFEWDGGNPFRIEMYLRFLGLADFRIATREQESRVIGVLATMPVFPETGSIAIVDDVVLLRLGPHPNQWNLQAIEAKSANQ